MNFGNGDNCVRFKPEVRKRTTITLGDSYNRNSEATVEQAPASRLNDLDDRFMWTTVGSDRKGNLVPSKEAVKGGSIEKAAERLKDTRDYRDLANSAGAE